MSRSLPAVRAAFLALLALGTAAAASATVVTGRVTDGTAGLAGIDLDFIDTATATSIPLTGDRTDALGNYAVTVPPGTYDVQFEPPVGDRHVALERPGMVISGGSRVLDQVLVAGFFLSARVVDPASIPQASVTLEATRVPGARVYSPYDRTDAAGAVRIVVPSGTFDLLFNPPGSGPLLSEPRTGVAIAADTDLGTITLRSGLALSGRIVGEDGPPLADVRVSVADPATGVTRPGGSVLTDIAGNYTLWLEAGENRLDAVPAQGTPYLTRSLHGVSLAGDLALPDLPLDLGVIVDGVVHDAAARGIEGVDLDFDNTLTNRRVRTLRDNTDAAGAFAIAVRPGIYDIHFEPPAATGLAPARLDDLNVPTNTTLPPVVLLAGFVLSGRVMRPGGVAPGVDIDVFDEVSGRELALGTDDTDAAGRFAVTVPAGRYRLDFDPPDLSNWTGATRTAVMVTANIDMGDTLLGASVIASVTSIDPLVGPETGGTLVTVSGNDFQAGLHVTVGGMPLRGVTVLSPSSLQGTTSVRNAGIVDVTVTNRGAATATLVDGFLYEPVVPDPLLMLRREGPLNNDMLLAWSSTGQSGYRIFRSTSLAAFGQAELQEGVVTTSWRDEGGLLVPGLVFYVVR